MSTLNVLERSVVGATLDENPSVRRWAIRFSERQLDREFPLGFRDELGDGQLLLQVAYSLGAVENDDAYRYRAEVTLARLAIKHADDPYLVAAVLSSVNEKNLAGVLATVLKESGDKGPPSNVVSQLMRMATGMKNTAAQTELLTAAATPKDGKYARWQIEIAAGWFANPIKIPAKLQNQLTKLQTACLPMILDKKAAESDRIAAIRFVGRGEAFTDAEKGMFAELLGPTSSPALRSAAITHIGSLSAEAAPLVLIQNWKSQTPATRAQILDVLLARKDGGLWVVSAIEAKSISAGEIDAARRQRLLNHPDAKIRERAAKVFDGAINADRAKVLKEYADTPANGDAAKGKAVFTKVCAACHKLGDVGVHVGPDLAALTNRTRDYLLQEILDPNRNVDSRYVEYQAITKNMRTVSGILVGETATSITLRGQQRKDETLLRSDIEELRGSGKSLMPEGLEKDLPKRDMADLLAFLTADRPAPKQFPGNTPTVIKPADSRLRLRADSAEIRGDQIAFEPDFKNIGMWHGVNDTAEWRIELPKAATFDVYLDYACDAGSAGNELLLESGESAMKWKVESTGAWSQYRNVKIGTIKLAAGEGRIVVRPAGTLRGALIDLRTVHLVPPGKTP
jgi:putative heme-binding domain-containing protein